MLDAPELRIYRWSDESGTVLLDALESRFPVASEQSWPVETTWADTFDGRLDAVGWTLLRDEGPSASTLRILDESGRSLLRAPESPLPSFSHEAQPERCRELLDPVCGIRRLLPLARRRGRRQGLRILDRETKTVVRLVLETGEVEAPTPELSPGEARTAPWPSTLKVRQVRGYPEAFAEICAWIERSFPTARIGEEDLEAARRLLDLPPPESSRPEIPLEPSEPALRAVRRILAALLEVVRRNERGVLADLDAEFLHDLRVAVRRARSILGQVRDVLPGASARDLRRELKWLQKATGPLRDLDVQLLELPDVRLELPPRHRADLDPLEGYLLRHRDEELETLRRALSSERTADCLSLWEDVAEGRLEEEVGDRAAEPISEVARERIDRAWKRIRKKGRKIVPETEARALHRLRIDGKKLRYLLEMFGDLWPTEQIRPLVKTLKKLQDNLGDHQDCEVQQERLLEIARGMVADGDAPPETLLALGRLAAHLGRRQRKERKRFAKLFRRFDERKTAFREFFGSPG